MLRVSSVKLSAILDNISIKLDAKEQLIFDLLRNCSATLGVVCRGVGGFVRDKLLGKNTKDIDITVEGMSGAEFAEQVKNFCVQKYGPQQTVVGSITNTEERPEQIKNLSVAFLKIYGQEVEILSLRGNEVYQAGDRNPTSVDKNATPQEDALRRDLTINSLFYNINTGKIEDFTGQGYHDLSTMTLRTPLEPVKTFTDDPLRLLRVLRFHSKFPTSKIAPEVIEAMQNPDVQMQIVRKIHNKKETQGIVTERTLQEFEKIMMGEQPEAALRIMYNTGLLQKMLNLPTTFHPLNMDQANKHHQLTVIDHTLEVLKNNNRLCKQNKLSDTERMMMNISSLFHDLGKLDPRSHNAKPDGSRGYAGNPNDPNGLTHQQSSADVWNGFADALGVSNVTRDFVFDVVSNHMNPHGHVDTTPNDKQLRKYIRKNPSWLFHYMHAMADAMSKSTDGNSRTIPQYQQNIDRMHQLAPAAWTSGNMPKSNDLLNGKEIMELVGLPVKPRQGQIGYIELVKEHIRDIQDGNPALTKDQAIQAVRDMISANAFADYQTNPTVS